MIGEIPTRLGDVLVLTTERAGSIHQVCPVSSDGQQGCTVDRHTVSRPPIWSRNSPVLVNLRSMSSLLVKPVPG